MLIRQPLDTAPFEPGLVADPQAFVHHWQDGNWQWTLALWGQSLSPEELEPSRKQCARVTRPR